MKAPPGMEVRRFDPGDMLLLQPQSAQLAELPVEARVEHGHELAANGSAFTLWRGADAIFCGGHVQRHRAYATLWGWFSVYHREATLFIIRAVRAHLADLPHRRVDMQVAASNGGACSWAGLIGLTEEARLCAAMPDGSDAVVFVRLGGPTAPLLEDRKAGRDY